MNVSDYRADFAAYSRACERERYRLYAAGQDPTAPTPEFARIQERFSDLHTPDTVAALRQTRDRTPPEFETERTGLARLAGYARGNFIARRAEETRDELRDCLTRRRIKFDNQDVPLARASLMLADEGRGSARRELSARLFDELLACDDLRLAHQRARAEAADKIDSESINAEGSRALHVEADDGLASFAQAYLQQTEQVYRQRLPHHLSRALSGELSGEDLHRPAYADRLRLDRLPHLDRYFPARQLLPTYEAALRSLHLNLDGERRIHLHTSDTATDAPFAHAFALEPPADVRLEARTAKDGANLYRAFLLAAGRAQHFAWSSAELHTRHPEFVCPMDSDGVDSTTEATTRAGCAQMFALVLQDAGWLGEHRGLRPEEAQRVARALDFITLFRGRRAAGRLIARGRAASLINAPGEEQATEYAAQMSDATGFVYDARLYLSDVLGADSPATELRAYSFAAAMREGLRTRYGSRWWANKGTRDEFVDLWNTGTRYTLEELARAAGGGAPDVGTLAGAHLETLRGAEA